jgi:hypothetical protein
LAFAEQHLTPEKNSVWKTCRFPDCLSAINDGVKPIDKMGGFVRLGTCYQEFFRATGEQEWMMW